MIVLGIETSCDETSVAIVTDQHQILAHVLLTEWELHRKHGGIVPEIAARSHLEHLDTLIQQALRDASLSLNDISAVAATGGPGLIGGVIVGITTAKALALALEIPFLAVNHLAGHILTARLTHKVNFPYLTLLVSGGHCQLLIVQSALNYELLGETLDDAVGEAFDKTGRLLNLPYPGGPNIEKKALEGNPLRFHFPRPLLSKKDPQFACSFSLSGLKTAVRQTVETLGELSDQDRADCAASFQYTMGLILCNRVLNALNYCEQKKMSLTTFVLAGGVAANHYLRHELEKITKAKNVKFVAPPPNLCTDNAVMIAWGGIEKMHLNQVDSLTFKPRPRWPLTDLGNF